MKKKIFSFLLSIAMMLSMLVTAQARLVGDVDKSGEVNSADALLVLQNVVGTKDDIDKKIADVNNDGEITSADALTILCICVGIYDGELEVDDEKQKTMKEKVIDPIIMSESYTISTSVSSDGEEIPTVIMIDGNNMSATIKKYGVECRLLSLNGNTYLVFPSLKVYMESEESVNIGDISTDKKLEFISSGNIVISKTTYFREVYSAGENDTYYYYFLNGVWKKTAHVKDGNTEIQNINYYKVGVDSSCFSLEGLTKINK